MDAKEMVRNAGKGFIIRRAASMLAHKKDYKGYLAKQTDFSASERSKMREKAEVIGEDIRKGGKGDLRRRAERAAQKAGKK